MCIALIVLTWVVGFHMCMYFMYCLTVFVYNYTSQYCGLSTTKFIVSWELYNCMTSTCTVSVQYTVCLPVTLTNSSAECWKKMFVLVVTVVLSVSFCLSDGCEGQSLLAVSQNGLSLSLASLFSGICRLNGWARLHSYNTDSLLLRGSSERKPMAPLQTENITPLILPVKLDGTSTITNYSF